MLKTLLDELESVQIISKYCEISYVSPRLIFQIHKTLVHDVPCDIFVLNILFHHGNLKLTKNLYKKSK